MESTEASKFPSFDEDLFWVKGEKCSEIHGKKNNSSLALSYFHIAMINDHEWGVDKDTGPGPWLLPCEYYACAFGNAEIINDEKYDCSYNDTS